MTTEEKLQHFLDTCMEDARTRSNRMLDEYMNALEETFKQHQADAKRRSAMQIEQETEKIEREINKKLAVEQIDIRRALGQKQEELKDKLFVELRPACQLPRDPGIFETFGKTDCKCRRICR